LEILVISLCVAIGQKVRKKGSVYIGTTPDFITKTVLQRLGRLD